MSITLSYIIPAYNEEAIIRESIERFTKDLTNLSDIISSYEIIIVDDRSTDRTAEIVAHISTQDQRIRLIQQKRNGGVGRAILTGLTAATMDWISVNCVDQPFKTSDIRKLAPFFQDNDLIIICRKNRSANHWYRKLTSYGNYALIRFILWSGVHDFQFAQFYRREQLAQMNIVTRGTLVPPEMILRCLHQGARTSEIFLDFHKRPGGKAKYGHPKYIFIALIEMCYLRFHFWKERWMSHKHLEVIKKQ